MIDEEEDRCPFDMIIGIACPTTCLKPPHLVTGAELHKFIGNSSTVELPNPVYC